MGKTGAQLDREIAEALSSRRSRRKPHRHHSSIAAPNVDGKQPLYGHTSEATAYLVEDYPYGLRERTQIRYWLENKGKKGWRFVSQTMNPKTNRWNKPKASTYTEFGGAMYLDDKGHVKWEGVGQYSDENKIGAFVRTFPGADMSVLRQFVPAKLKYLRGEISGQIVWKVNGVPQTLSEADIADRRKELEAWEEINVWLDQAKA